MNNVAIAIQILLMVATDSDIVDNTGADSIVNVQGKTLCLIPQNNTCLSSMTIMEKR